MNSLVHGQCIDYEGGDKRLGHYVPGVGFDTTPGYMYIPSHFSNPYINGNYNIWNCMWLSHLLKGVMESLPTKLLLLRSKRPDIWNFVGKLKKRGKYDTRRKGKYWWKNIQLEYDIKDKDFTLETNLTSYINLIFDCI